MSTDHRVALDANCITFYMEAMWSGYDPAHDRTELAGERAALLLAWLYTGHTYTLLPVAESEYLRIGDADRRAAHHIVARDLMLDVADPIPDGAVRARVAELRTAHSGESDCRTLAEAELVPVATLLTFDKRMLSRLQREARGVKVATPSAYLRSLGLGLDARPILEPKDANPLARLSWWKSLAALNGI